MKLRRYVVAAGILLVMWTAPGIYYSYSERNDRTREEQAKIIRELREKHPLNYYINLPGLELDRFFYKDKPKKENIPANDRRVYV